MSITLGLNTALSGLLTNQRGLDVIAQNVVNVNTAGYTRKVLNLESRVLAGRGAGVQEGSVTRMVNEGLLKDIRKQTSALGKLEVEQAYYPRIDDLYGEVGEQNSIAHKVESLKSAFETLATEANKPAVQWSTMQAGVDLTNKLKYMSEGLQSLRAEADKELETTVGRVNEILANIHDLNQKIVKNAAIATGVSDLEDKRDVALTELASLIDIQYFKRSDGAMTVYSGAGLQLVDNQNVTLTYTSSTTIEPWMTVAGGDFNAITIGNDPTDITSTISGGKLRALADLRDTVLANTQAEIDKLATSIKATINQVHNRGTSMPAIAESFTGSRVFATQGTIVATPAANPEDSATLRSGSITLTPADYGSITFGPGNTSYPWQATMTGSGVNRFTEGSTFSVAGAENPLNDGTYRVVANNGANSIVVEKVNPTQTMQLGSSDDVVIATFDEDGNQLFQTTLNTIMQTDFDAAGYGPTGTDERSSANFLAKSDHGTWSIDEVAAHTQAWLRSQGYGEAVCALNSENKLVIDLNQPGVSLAFRDQVSSAAGAATEDVTIKFDVDGDGASDQTVQGFSNFFGLNDFFVSEVQNSIQDSTLMASTYTTTVTRNLRILDDTGQVGREIGIAAGSSLQDIADRINQYTRTNESALQNTDTVNLTSAATITVSDGSSNLMNITVGPGQVSLNEMAGLMTKANCTGSVIRDGAGYRLQIVNAEGKQLSVSVSGGSIANSSESLSGRLSMTATNRVEASVIPEGSGYRLRISQSGGKELFLASDVDVNGTSLLTDLSMTNASTGMAGNIIVRDDIRSAPEKIARGAMLWNADANAYMLSAGDNTTALALGDAMSSKVAVGSAGGIYSGDYTLSEYASASVSMAARLAGNSKEAYQYQKTLSESLDFQYSSYSGVNLDEEVANMIDFQQAYSASAKVISTLKEMLDVLNSIVQ